MKCTILDLSHVIANMPQIENLSFVGEDMFQSIPHADAIVLKLAQLVVENVLAFNEIFWIRLAAREDTCKFDDDKEWFHFLISSAGLCFVTSFNLQNKNMPPKRRNGNQSASQPEEPLGEHVSYAEFRAACTTLAQSITSQNE
ncbi:Chavicol O-methyltransferase [Capsicum chinense]|nr:Chavicol O-methyltransferase [Capsicum chinense]